MFLRRKWQSFMYNTFEKKNNFSLIHDTVSFEQLGPVCGHAVWCKENKCHLVISTWKLNIQASANVEPKYNDEI